VSTQNCGDVVSTPTPRRRPAPASFPGAGSHAARVYLHPVELLDRLRHRLDVDTLDEGRNSLPDGELWSCPPRTGTTNRA
jgi:hypothetical protein